MGRSPLQSAVVQSISIIVLNMILCHEINRNAYDGVWEDPVLKNFTSTFGNMTSAAMAPKTTVPTNGTSLTGKANSFKDTESFYLKSMPRDLFVQALLVPLCYYWQILLERLLPTRPRGVEVSYEKSEKSGIDGNEDREEEVVKHWIAQGKVRRSSVSWWNTFVKWVLNLSIGRLWYNTLWHLIDGCVRWRSFKIILGDLQLQTLFRFLTSFWGIGPLADLMSFIVIPATKRTVFESAINLVENVFLSAFVRLAFPWVISTQLAQMVMANVTEDILKPPGQFGGPPKPRLDTIGEL